MLQVASAAPRQLVDAHVYACAVRACIPEKTSRVQIACLFRSIEGDPELSTRALRASKSRRGDPQGVPQQGGEAFRAVRVGLEGPKNRFKNCRQRIWETRFEGARREGAGRQKSSTLRFVF